MNTMVLPASREVAAGIISRPPPPDAGPVKKKPAALLALAVCGLAGAGIGFFGMHYAVKSSAPVAGAKWVPLVSLALTPLVWLVAVGVHEFGHILGGWLVGGRFLLWQVGPVMVRRTPAGVRLGRNRGTTFGGGLAACIPRDPARLTPRRAAVMIVGGPVASLLLAFGAYWAAGGLVAGANSLPAIRALGQTVMVFTSAMSFLLFLLTVAPYAAGGFKSDGRRVFELLRGGPGSQQEAAMLVLSAARLAGVRPAENDPKLVALAVSLKDGSLFDRYGHMNAYYHYADRGDWPAAQSHLDYAVAGGHQLAPFVRDALRCEYAWLLATQAHDATSARVWLAPVRKLDFEPATLARAEAAVLLAEGRTADALAKAREALKLLDQESLSPVRNPFALAAVEAIIRAAADPCLTPPPGADGR